MSERDPEGPSRPKSLPHWRVIIDQGITNPEIESWPYQGNGTEEEPFAVVWMDNDPRNPLQWSYSYKWVIVLSSAFSVLGVTFASSAFSGGIRGLVEEFHTSAEVAILGLSLFVLGFAVGPLVSAPLSELYGRQVLFLVTFGCFTFFNAGVPGAQNIWTVLILRFFAGCFGSSPLSNAGGVIADCFSARDRGVAMSIFSAAPFLGPAVGPIIGGFLSESAGWRWLMGFMAAFTGFLWIVNSLIVPETYAPVLLRKRAEKLSKLTGKVYLSKLDIDRGKIVAGEAFKSALLRPWILLFREPIVFILSIYMAIVYGTLYMLFAAYPIVFEEGRGWSEGIQGLAFLAILIGMLFAISYNLFFDNKRYQRLVDKNGGFAPPEARLDTAIIGGIALPIGLFWFAWTNSPTLPWQASVAAGIPFGFGTCLVFLSVMVSGLTLSSAVVNQIAELSHRHVYDLRGFSTRSELYTTVVLWRWIPSLHILHVRQPWNSLGSFHTRVPCSCMCTVPIPLLQVRSGNPIELQVFCRSRCLHGAHP